MERSLLWLDVGNQNILGEIQMNGMGECKRNIKEHFRRVLARDNQLRSGANRIGNEFRLKDVLQGEGRIMTEIMFSGLDII